MLLPESFLQTIKYYESESLRYENYKYHDCITIYFKSIWKRKKVLKWQCVRCSEDGQNVVKTSHDYNELKKQLDEYFASIKNDLRL